MTLPFDAPILTADAMRAAEFAAMVRGTSLTALMERAGAAVADLAWRMAAGRPILILCGTGNNGGDGYVAARHLRERGADVLVARLGEPETDLAKAAAEGWLGETVSIFDNLQARPVVVDALFGVGLTRPLEAALREAVSPLQAGRVLAVDVPSGVDADGGQDWHPALRADICLALGALKPAHVLQPSAGFCGTVLRADMDERWESVWRTAAAADADDGAPDAGSHKFNRGMVLIASGPMEGAADLAARAALRAGAGYVVKRGGAAGYSAIISDDEDGFKARLADPRVGAVVIGAGYPAGEALTAEVAALWACGKALVLDAAAIDAGLAFMTDGPHQRRLILTPHEGEFARAFPDLTGSKIERALAAAKQTGAVIVYKGADLIVAAPDGRVSAHWPGSSWLATAGTGDVLAGACAAWLAKGGDVVAAACAAVRWHISKGSRIGRGLIADDLVRNEYE
jgi:hydroxyethylthiazole kinase-like uncharacterized protein yjeF